MREAPGGSIVALAFEIGYSEDGHSTLREWSSLIGIITAIVGNVLISFALNIQRYAHIRLDQDRSRRTKSWTGAKSRKAPLGGYGTQQEEERAKPNLDTPARDTRDEAPLGRYHGQNGERDGELLPLKQSRRSHDLSNTSGIEMEDEDDEVHIKSYLRSPYWWAGILLMTTGEAGNFLAYGFAPASIVAPLGVVALVSNCIIAPVLLKERFRQRDFWGVVVAAGGAVTVVLSAKTVETKMGPHDVWKAITRWEFETYLGITAGLTIALVWASGRYGHRTILIDLGLVALFGKPVCTGQCDSQENTNLWNRWLYCPFHQRSCLTFIGHPVADPYVSGFIPSYIRLGLYCRSTNTLCQPSFATFQFHAGHPHPVRSIHYLGHCWKCSLVPRF